jgi:hypothetical protein
VRCDELPEDAATVVPRRFTMSAIVESLVRRLRLWLSTLWALVRDYVLPPFIVVFVLLFGWRLLHPHEDVEEGFVWIGSLIPFLIVAAGFFGFAVFGQWYSNRKWNKDRAWDGDAQGGLALIGFLLAVTAIAWALSATVSDRAARDRWVDFMVACVDSPEAVRLFSDAPSGGESAEQWCEDMWCERAGNTEDYCTESNLTSPANAGTGR